MFEFLSQVDWENLWSGGAGAVLGAIVSIGILLGTNWWTRRIGADNAKRQAAISAAEQAAAMTKFRLEQAEAQRLADRAREDAKAEFEIQFHGQRELAREQRELDVVAELLTWLQVRHDSSPLNWELVPELMALCNRLTLHCLPEVTATWRECAANPFTSGLLRVQRHPLAHALVPWAAAHKLAAEFPDTVRLNGVDLDEDDDPRPASAFPRPRVVPAITDSDDFPRSARIQVERISREMLRWPELSSSQKGALFDPLVAIAKVQVDKVLAAVNFSLGSRHPDSTHRYWQLSNPKYSELLVVMKELGDIRSTDAFASLRERVEELGGIGYQPDPEGDLRGWSIDIIPSRSGPVADLCLTPPLTDTVTAEPALILSDQRGM